MSVGRRVGVRAFKCALLCDSDEFAAEVERSRCALMDPAGVGAVLQVVAMTRVRIITERADRRKGLGRGSTDLLKEVSKVGLGVDMAN